MGTRGANSSCARRLAPWGVPRELHSVTRCGIAVVPWISSLSRLPEVLRVSPTRCGVAVTLGPHHLLGSHLPSRPPGTRQAGAHSRSCVCAGPPHPTPPPDCTPPDCCIVSSSSFQLRVHLFLREPSPATVGKRPP